MPKNIQANLMPRSIRLKLSLMMFLQYFLWGAWWVTLGSYMVTLGFADVIGRTYATQGWGAIIAPLFVGMVADRYFSAQRILGVLHLIGGACLFYLSTVNTSQPLFYAVVFFYMGTFMPTIALSSAVAFNAMTNIQKEFPLVRVFGTIGWIVAGLSLSFVIAPIFLGDSDFTVEQTAIPIKLAACCAVVLGFFSFTLPDTPPSAQSKKSKRGVKEVLGLDIFKHVQSSDFWIFIVSSLLICIPLAFYYGYTNAFLVDKNVSNAVAIQSLGQVSEIVFLVLLPILFVRLGVKIVLLVGMICWSLRYLFFAYGYEGADIVLPMIVGGILLHGICYDFFFVAGQIYVDKRLPPETRGRAQSFLTLVTLGVGSLIGGELSNYLVNINTDQAGIDWQTVWLIPSGLAAIVAIGFAAFFKDLPNRSPS